MKPKRCWFNFLHKWDEKILDGEKVRICSKCGAWQVYIIRVIIECSGWFDCEPGEHKRKISEMTPVRPPVPPPPPKAVLPGLPTIPPVPSDWLEPPKDLNPIMPNDATQVRDGF